MDWKKNFSASITVCNIDGIITYMNDRAAESFANNGGYELIGKSMFDCHQQSSNKKITEIMETGTPNVYTIEKNGKKKFIYQAPHFENEKVAGIVEISIEIPFDMPHHIRS